VIEIAEQVGLDIVQLSGKETYANDVKFPTWKAVHVDSSVSSTSIISEANKLEIAGVLLDTSDTSARGNN
jgi:phosphoribosylanthranilate isomerase